jgi:hypothetical protein
MDDQRRGDISQGQPFPQTLAWASEQQKQHHHRQPLDRICPVRLRPLQSTG